ncbi:MAG: hypothetical protein FJ291_20365 [Planctomycetes bacterium]|nr:hypothetical protein [Planctomycetota bacterium]
MKPFPISDFRFPIAWAMACLAVGLGGCGFLKARKPPAPAVPVVLVPEMEPIAGLDGGTPCKPEEFAADVAKAQADWAAKRPGIEPLVTAQKVRELSRWAKKEMQEYRRVPSLAKVAFRPAYLHKEAGHLVLEGTADTLPTHSPLVTRWLKVYLLYDQGKQAIVKVAVTIRGEVQE